MLVDRGVAPLSRSGRPEAFDARQQYPDIGPEPGKPRIPRNRSQAWCKTTKPRGRSPDGTAPTPPGRGRRRLSSPARSHQFELGLFRLHPAQGHVPLRETACTPRRPCRRGTLAAASARRVSSDTPPTGATTTDGPRRRDAQHRRTGRGALTEIKELERGGQLAGYQYLAAIKADLLQGLGRTDEASVAYRQAPELTRNETERAFLAERLANACGS